MHAPFGLVVDHMRERNEGCSRGRFANQVYDRVPDAISRDVSDLIPERQVNSNAGFEWFNFNNPNYWFPVYLAEGEVTRAAVV